MSANLTTATVIKYIKTMLGYPVVDVELEDEQYTEIITQCLGIYGTYKPIEKFGSNFYTPYLNKKVIDFINSLPEEWINGGTSFQKLTNYAIRRRFHKMALLRYLPKRYVYGLQQSFDVPWHVLFNKRPEILKILKKRLKKRGWYNESELDRIFEEFFKQKARPHEILELKHHGYRIYSLLVFEVWCMEFLDNPNYNKHIKPKPLEEYLSK